MSDNKNIVVGARVEVNNRDVTGTVVFVGTTTFASGKWVGLVLDEPKGKNNGTINGQSYFHCEDNYGAFFRPTQLKLIGGTELQAATSMSTYKSADDITAPAMEISKPTAAPTIKSKLSNSRLSLAASRQSLIASRSQLSLTPSERTGPSGAISTRRSIKPPSATTGLVKSRSSISQNTISSESAGADGKVPVSTSNVSKCSSFIESGFMEILKPQFTPSQPMRSPSFTVPASASTNLEDKTLIAEQRKQIEDLTLEVNDLTEKIETLKQRRNEDKERLREYEKMEVQYEQLQEFRSKIMVTKATLQKELQRAKQEAKDAIEAKEQHAQEMAELADNVELITLDKEMAEEKSDTLQLELDVAKERIEELQVDLEILRSEVQRGQENVSGYVGNNGNITNFEFKQLEQQNQRLKETLVRLRDLSAHDKHNIHKLTKELEMKRSEVAELERTKEKLSTNIDKLETNIADLQEQVDIALGAEGMVEQLVGRKMELEDKVKLLEEEVSQLEALEEVHEQLIESNHDLEMDLREELDMVYASKKDMIRERDAAIETIYDRDQTITKFRELVQKLNERLIEVKDKGYIAEEPKSLQDNQNKITTESIDYKQMFAESKAYTRAIDVQLRQIELSQANEHVHMLMAFMPESFMNRGGDHDSILVILLISRLIYKCEIIINQTRERFPAVDKITCEAIFRDYKIQQYSFKCRLMHYIHNLQYALHQILYGLNNCQPETLLRAGNSLPEMIAQEKIIDGIIELLKSNQLDENTPTDLIEKCAAFFNAMNSVLITGEDLLNETEVIRDCVAAIGVACDSISTDISVICTILKKDNDSNDTILLIQYITDNIETIKQQIKLIKRRLPHDQNVVKCGISAHKLDSIRHLIQNISRVMASIHISKKLALNQIVSHIEDDTVVEHTIEIIKFNEFLSHANEQIYEQDDRGPAQNYKSILTQSANCLQQIAQHLLEKEYEILSTDNQRQEKSLTPIILRAQLIKKQLEQKNVLAATLENREADIKQLKLAAKMKQNELSEMQIRKDLAEKKLTVMQAEYEHTVEKWKRQYEEAKVHLQQKEKEFEVTMDHLQGDIEALENEKLSLREKLKLTVAKRSESPFLTSNNTVSSSLASLPFPSIGIGSATPMLEEIQLLKHVLKSERTKRLKLEAEHMKERLRKLEPIYIPKPKDKRLIQLETELTKVKNAWILSLINQPFADRNKGATIHGSEAIKIAVQRKDMPIPSRSEVVTKAHKLATDIIQEYLKRHPHRKVPTDFGLFPSMETKQALQL